jgi:hypothetical protein
VKVPAGKFAGRGFELSDFSSSIEFIDLEVIDLDFIDLAGVGGRCAAATSGFSFLARALR